MSYAAQRRRLFVCSDCRLCNANSSLAGDETHAALLFRSEAQDKTQEQ